MNNTVILIGRLTNDIELRYTSNNRPVINQSIAVTRSQKNQEGVYETDFINFQAWGKIAERINEFCEKGDLIGIKGQLRIDNYQDKDGNKKSKTYVLLENVSFLANKHKKEKINTGVIKEVMEEKDPFQDFAEETEEQFELPF